MSMSGIGRRITYLRPIKNKIATIKNRDIKQDTRVRYDELYVCLFSNFINSSVSIFR